MLALAYWSLMSCGLRQVALIASAYQLCSGPRASAQPGRSQNLCRLLLAMTLTADSVSQFGRNGKSAIVREAPPHSHSMINSRGSQGLEPAIYRPKYRQV